MIVFQWERFCNAVIQARSQDFSNGDHAVSNIIVMAFSPRNIVGVLLKKGLQRGGGSRAPQDPLPRYAFPLFWPSNGVLSIN